MPDNPQLPADAPQPTYEAIIVSAFGLEPSSSPADIKAVLTQVVAAKLSPIETSKVLETAAVETKVAKKVLAAELKQLTQQALVSTDPAFIVAQTLLSEEFNLETAVG